MRAREFLSEETALTLAKVTKDQDRPDQFFQLINTGHTFNSSQGPVVISKSEVNRLKPLLVRSNVGNKEISKQLILKTADNKTIPMSSLFYDQTAFTSVGARKPKSVDVGIKLKATDVLGHKSLEKGQTLTPDLAIDLGAVEGKNLGNSIIASTHLQSQGPAGLAVIEMAKQIMSKQVPQVPQLEKSQLTAIQNDAFEYLGVLSLIHNVAKFPNSEDFYNHVGVDLNSMLLYFPGSTTSPLADSFALVNKKTKKTIFISSKAGKSGKGAPSSIRVLEIPKYLLEEPSETVEFIQTCQTLPAMYQPFKAANFIFKRYPDSLGLLAKHMPFDNKFLDYITQVWNNRNLGVPETLEEIPEQYRPIFQLVQDKMKSSRYPLFYNLRNYVKDHCVGPAVNSKKAIPEFSSMMMEMLAQNYIKLSTKNVEGQFVTNVQWPYKMGGNIVLEPKDSADKWGGSMTWLLL